MAYHMTERRHRDRAPGSAMEPPTVFLSNAQSTTMEAPSITSEHVAMLGGLLVPEEKLLKYGYILNLLSKEDLELKERCTGCGKTMSSLSKGKARKNRWADKNQNTDKNTTNLASGPDGKDCKENERDGKHKKKSDLASLNEQGGIEKTSTLPGRLSKMETDVPENLVCMSLSRAAKESPGESIIIPMSSDKPLLRCKFHSGTLQNKIWSCCRGPSTSAPCSGAEQHVAKVSPAGEIERDWQFYHTPAPHPKHSKRICPAVAIDCEMGTTASNDTELIRVTMIDYQTSTVLVDSLVYPDVPMLHLNTRLSGVTWQQMNQARRNRTCLFGRAAARRAIWKFVGPETVVVGHGCGSDLKALRWIHKVVVDTHLLKALQPAEPKAKTEQSKPVAPGVSLTAEEERAKPTAQGQQTSSSQPEIEQGKPDQAENCMDQQKKKTKKGSGPTSLKSLARAKLGREIQNAGKKGHDSVEDALAARDLAQWVLLNSLNGGTDSST